MTGQNSILKGTRVLDLTRLAPGPYGSMLLADMGAEVIVVGGGRSGLPIDCYRRGKRFVNLDLKSEEGLDAFRLLAADADVLMEGFRPGVMHRLGLGYEALKQDNPKLVYCSVTGYGQDGPLAQEAGHDINYVGLSGALGAMGPLDGPPALPLNIIADFAAGGLYAAYSILGALLERERSGLGQFLDVAMVDGCLSLMTMHYPDWGKPVLPSRGKGLLTGEAPFYRCYVCNDGKYLAVGALEGAFFANLWRGLNLEQPMPDHMRPDTWPAMTEQFERLFASRSRDAWVKHFEGRDACVSPVLAPDEVFEHPHVQARFPGSDTYATPAIPHYSRTPTMPGVTDGTDDSHAVLRALGLSEAKINKAVPETSNVTGLVWPPVKPSQP